MHCPGCGGIGSPTSAYGHILGCGCEESPRLHPHELPDCCEKEPVAHYANARGDRRVEGLLSVALDLLWKQGRTDTRSISGRDLAKALNDALIEYRVNPGRTNPKLPSRVRPRKRPAT